MYNLVLTTKVSNTLSTEEIAMCLTPIVTSKPTTPTKQLIPFQNQAEINFAGTKYRATLEIEAEILPPDAPCSNCKKTTQRLMAAHGVPIALDCSDEMIMRAATKLSDEGLETLEATTVYAIRKVSVSEVIDLEIMADVVEEELGGMIEKIIQTILIEHVVCNGCMFSPETKYFTQLLAA